MALNKITYDNKVALDPQPSIANVNKCTADDLNEIKSVVNSGIDYLNLFNIEEIPISLTISGSNIILYFTFENMLTTGLLIIQGLFEGETVVQISILANYGTRYSTKLVSTTGSNINMSTTALSSDGATLTIPCLGNVPTGIGSVKAYLIQI